MNFSSLDHFFSTSVKERNASLYEWGQTNLVSLFGKDLEKACSQLIEYFRSHPEQALCNNFLLPENYWKHHGDKPTHYQVNYGFKEYVMNILVYKECDYISFDDSNTILWDTDKKKIRFIYKDSQDRKTQPNKQLESHFTLQQKDIIWAGIAVGFLDVVIPEKKSKKQIAAESENSNDENEEVKPEKIKKSSVEAKSVATKQNNKKIKPSKEVINSVEDKEVKHKEAPNLDAQHLDSNNLHIDTHLTLTQEDIVQGYCHTNNAALTTKNPSKKNSQSSIRAKNDNVLDNTTGIDNNVEKPKKKNKKKV